MGGGGGGRYVDLFVKADNTRAVDYYRRLGYATHRVVPRYYDDGTDALDMRKPLPRPAPPAGRGGRGR